MQIRALAQRRITIDCINQALGDGFGIQAEKLGKLTHTFAMSQADDDGTPIGWHSHKRYPFHVLYTHRCGKSSYATSHFFRFLHFGRGSAAIGVGLPVLPTDPNGIG